MYKVCSCQTNYFLFNLFMFLKNESSVLIDFLPFFFAIVFS